MVKTRVARKWCDSRQNMLDVCIEFNTIKKNFLQSMSWQSIKGSVTSERHPLSNMCKIALQRMPVASCLWHINSWSIQLCLDCTLVRQSNIRDLYNHFTRGGATHILVRWSTFKESQQSHTFPCWYLNKRWIYIRII